MADVGRIQKTYDMYVDQETACEAIALGAIVCPNGAKVENVDADATATPPYGIALEAATADAETILVAWRGVVEAAHDILATDALTKNLPVMVSQTTTAKLTGWTTASAEYLIVGHALEAATSTTAEVKIMLAGW